MSIKHDRIMETPIIATVSSEVYLLKENFPFSAMTTWACKLVCVNCISIHFVKLTMAILENYIEIFADLAE